MLDNLVQHFKKEAKMAFGDEAYEGRDPSNATRGPGCGTILIVVGFALAVIVMMAGDLIDQARGYPEVVFLGFDQLLKLVGLLF